MRHNRVSQPSQQQPVPSMQPVPPGQQPAMQAPPVAGQPGAGAMPPGYMMAPVPPPRKRGLRPFSWVILAFNALMLVWLIVGIATAPKATNCGVLDAKTCQDATDVGTGIGVVLLVVLWVIVDIILGIIWLVTRPRQR